MISIHEDDHAMRSIGDHRGIGIRDGRNMRQELRATALAKGYIGVFFIGYTRS